MSSGHWRILEKAPEVAGEVALEAADGFAAGHAFCLATLEVGDGGCVALPAAEDDGVQGAVELAVSATVEPEAALLAARRWDRGDTCEAGEARFCGDSSVTPRNTPRASEPPARRATSDAADPTTLPLVRLPLEYSNTVPMSGSYTSQPRTASGILSPVWLRQSGCGTRRRVGRRALVVLRTGCSSSRYGSLGLAWALGRGRALHGPAWGWQGR